MKTVWMSCLLALLMTLPLRAEQMKELGPWQVHYSAFNSSFLTPEVAKAYGLERSRYNGICACVSLLGVTDTGRCPSRQRDHTARHADANQGCCASGSPSGRK